MSEQCNVPLHQEVPYNPNGVPASEILCREAAWSLYVQAWYNCQAQHPEWTCEEKRACNLAAYATYLAAIGDCVAGDCGCGSS